MRLLGLGFFLFVQACSLLVDSSTNGLKCAVVTTPNGATQRQCDQGSTCRGEDCVFDHSVQDGGTCTDDKQCPEGSICPSGIWTCGKPCTRIYDLQSECGPDHICAPVADDNAKGKFSGGVCLESECSGNSAEADATCAKEGGKVALSGPSVRCVKVSQNGGLCLPACTVGRRTIDVPTGGKDQCSADARKNPQHCGRLPAGDFVCLPVGAAQEGAKCTLFPQTSAMASEDACDIGQPGLPLVCLNAQGSSDAALGELRCRRAACEAAPGTMDSCPQSPMPQVCETKLALMFCKGPSE